MDSVDLFFLTAEAEVLQMVIILLISKPFSAAMDLVGKIAVPMIVMNSVGMVIFLRPLIWCICGKTACSRSGCGSPWESRTKVLFI